MSSSLAATTNNAASAAQARTNLAHEVRVTRCVQQIDVDVAVLHRCGPERVGSRFAARVAGVRAVTRRSNNELLPADADPTRTTLRICWGSSAPRMRIHWLQCPYPSPNRCPRGEHNTGAENPCVRALKSARSRRPAPPGAERPGRDSAAMAITRTDLWPPFGLVIQSGDLRLTPVSDDDLLGLVDLALDGIHPADMMPFDVPGPRHRPTNSPAATPSTTGKTRPVRAGAVQSGFRRAPGRRPGRGPGLHRRPLRDHPHRGDRVLAGGPVPGSGHRNPDARGDLHLALRPPGGDPGHIGAFVDNPASLAVSRKLGYRPNGVVRRNRLGTLALNQQLALNPGDLVRGEPIEVVGLEPLRRFLGLD